MSENKDVKEEAISKLNELFAKGESVIDNGIKIHVFINNLQVFCEQNDPEGDFFLNAILVYITAIMKKNKICLEEGLRYFAEIYLKTERFFCSSRD